MSIMIKEYDYRNPCMHGWRTLMGPSFVTGGTSLMEAFEQRTLIMESGDYCLRCLDQCMVKIGTPLIYQITSYLFCMINGYTVY